jgi:hypothetical protein
VRNLGRESSRSGIGAQHRVDTAAGDHCARALGEENVKWTSTVVGPQRLSWLGSGFVHLLLFRTGERGAVAGDQCRIAVVAAHAEWPT